MFNTLGYTNFRWLWHCFLIVNLPSRLLLILKLNRLSPSLLPVSRDSSLLRLSPPPLSRTILVRLFLPITQNYQNDSDFSCSIQNPILPSCQLYPGCHVNSNQVSFTLLTDTYVNIRFRHLLFAFTRLNSWFNLFSSTILTYRDRVPVFPYRSPPREFPPNAA